MEAVFLRLLNMSITAGWLVLAVLLLRLVLKNAPKALRCALWALIGVRLVFPFSFESGWSLLPSAEPIPMAALQTGTITVDTGIDVLDQAVNPAIAEVFAPAVTDTAQTATPVSSPTVVSVTQAAAVIWLMGMALMLLYTAVSYWRLRCRVAASIPAENGLWLCDGIETPFILGILRPRIYVPSTMPEDQLVHVAAHERAHLRRRDHWWKPLGFLLLSIHWFNPLLWLAYILLCRDIELACDEKVIRDMGAEDKKAYSLALLETSVPRRMVAACPLAFGEVGVKARIRSVLHYKKPAFWLAVLAVILCVIAAVCLLTNPYESTRLMGGEYKVTEILYAIPDYNKATADYPEFCLTADYRLYIKENESWELVDALSADSLTPERFLEGMFPYKYGWTGKRGLPSIEDSWGFFLTENGTFYQFMQTESGQTLLAYGWEDISERHDGSSDDSSVFYLCRLENQLGEHEFNVNFFARSLQEKVGSSVEPFAYWSHAHKPGYAVVGFHAGEGANQNEMPDMGYAVFETENGGYLLKDWQVCPGAAQTPSRIITAGTAVLGDTPTDASTYDVILSSNPYLHTVKRVYYKGDTQLGEAKYLADSPYSMLMLPWDAYPEADRVSQYFYDEQGREIDPDAETIPSSGQIAPLLGNAVSPDGRFELRLEGVNTAVTVPAVPDAGIPPEKKYFLPEQVVDRLSWEYEAEIQKLADYPEAALEVYDLREPWEDTLYLRWGNAARCFDGDHINTGGLSFQHCLMDADGDGAQELVVIDSPGTGTGISVDSLHIFQKNADSIVRHTFAPAADVLRYFVQSMIDPNTRAIETSNNFLLIPEGLDLTDFALGNLVAFSITETGVTGSWRIQFVKEGTVFRGTDDYAVQLTADIHFSDGAFILTSFRLSHPY